MERTFYLLSILCFSIFLSSLNAQPANDHPCDATEITLAPNGTTYTLSLKEATVDPNELLIAPQVSHTCQLQEGTWCGNPDDNPDLVITKSVWYKFVVTTDELILMNTCGSNFDTQLALYRVGDCADFSTYEFVWATDNSKSCGVGAGETKASYLAIGCLEPGSEYLLLVDEGSDALLSPAAPQDVVLEVIAVENNDPGPSIVDLPNVLNPTCPGGSDGLVEICLLSGTPPVRYEWNHGATTKNVYDLSAGTYTCTLTDNCGLTSVLDFDIEEGDDPDPIVLGTFPNEVVHPSSCGSGAFGGQVSVVATQGVGPFRFNWSNGDSLSVVSGLTDGKYTVTVTDVCDLEETVNSYYVGMQAGEDIERDTDCSPMRIGLDHSASGGEVTALTYSTDQSLDLGMACRSGGYSAHSATWRAFDLANDFGISETVDLAGVEVFIKSIPNFDHDIGVKVKFTLFSASTLLLEDPNLQLEVIDSIETYIGEIPTYSPYVIPFKAKDLAATTNLVVKLETLTESRYRHFLDFAANTTPTTQPVYFTSTDCGYLQPITFDSLGLAEKTIMNLLLVKNQGLTYNWDGPVDDPHSPTPMALGTESQTYTVTITDATCDRFVVEEVHVSCKTVATTELWSENLKISPNPSNGLFQISGHTTSQDMDVQVFDLQGKQLYDQNWQGNNGGERTLDLSNWTKGVYVLKVSYEGHREVHRLVVQ